MKQSYHFLFILFLVCFTSKLYSQSVPSYVPTNGLVGWWGFNGNAQDGSGNGNHGTVINGGVSLTSDRLSNTNSAYFFDGSDSWISIPYSSSLYFSNQYSVSLWFNKFGSTNTYAGDLITKERDVEPGSITVRVLNSNPTIVGFSASNVGTAQSISNVINNQWYHMVGTIENGEVKIYVNGILEYTTTNLNNQIGYNTSPFWIGKQKGTGWPGFFYLWNGKIDDIGMWNRSLTQQEITNLYNSQNQTPCSTSIINNVNISGCGFAVLSTGDTVIQSGTYGDTLLTYAGCDSIINQIVTIQNPSICNPVPSYVPNNGLVGWWGFNRNAQDGSGNGNHGIVNGATLTTDRFGNQDGAYSFDGQSSIQTLNSGPLGTGITLSYWYKTHLNNYMSLVSYGSLNWGQYFDANLNHWAAQHIGPCFGPSFHNRGTIINKNSFNIDSTIWSHVVIVIPNNISDLQSVDFYLNGNLLYTTCSFINYGAPSPNISNGNPIKIGNNWFNDGAYIGKVDDIGIWNRALTQQEITNLYNSQLPTQTSLCLPTITTNTPSSIGIDSVIVGGNITNDGGSSIVLRGVCYSTTPNPNMGNMRTEDGSGVGSFSTILRNLNPSTTYYVRSYAKNSNGVVVYGDEVSISTMSSPLIGSNYAGGIVFYVDSTGAHGLVCAPYDQGSFSWGCVNTFISSNNNIGSGLSNTINIISGCNDAPIAASICYDLVLNGYSDWFLPSLNELQTMFNNLLWIQQFPIGGFSFTNYWSSSQHDISSAYYVGFGNGGSVWHNSKYNFLQPVRAIRSF
jgi:hypothetical protein